MDKKRFSEAIIPYLTQREYQKEIHTYGAFDFVRELYLKRLRKYNKEYAELYANNLKSGVFWFVFLDFCKALNGVALLSFFFAGQITLGFLISLLMYIFVMDLNLPFGTFGMWTFFFDLYEKFMGFSEETDGSIDKLDTPLVLSFNDVWFNYPGTEKMMLKGITFTMKAGDKLAIVGANGAGKSTIIKIILGLYEPIKGSVTLNGVDLREYSSRLRSQIFAPVFQDAQKYQLSLKDNLLLGGLHSDMEISKVATKGGIGEIIERLGLNQLLGRDFEGGIDLSGGEWQRIAMTRALISDKPVMLLDEPTSQMDPLMECRLYEQFANISKGKTTLFISHRLGSARIMDRILVLNDGRIVEEGRHQELVANGRLYADMYNAQKEWYEGGKDDEQAG